MTETFSVSFSCQLLKYYWICLCLSCVFCFLPPLKCVSSWRWNRLCLGLHQPCMSNFVCTWNTAGSSRKRPSSLTAFLVFPVQAADISRPGRGAPSDFCALPSLGSNGTGSDTGNLFVPSRESSRNLVSVLMLKNSASKTERKHHLASETSAITQLKPNLLFKMDSL